MAVTTLKGHVSRALDFFNKANSYFILGKTTPWLELDRTAATPSSVVTVDDDHPPVPMTTDDIKEVMGYKKIEYIYMVVPDVTGELTYRDSKWKIVPVDQALIQGARWVYISTFLLYEELPLVTYRQVGVTTGLVKEDGVSVGKQNLLPNEVLSAGITEVVENRKPVYRQADQREQLNIVLEF